MSSGRYEKHGLEANNEDQNTSARVYCAVGHLSLPPPRAVGHELFRAMNYSLPSMLCPRLLCSHEKYIVRACDTFEQYDVRETPDLV